MILDPLGRNILRRWLAARYRRSAFPESNLSEDWIILGLKERIAKILARHGTLIRAIFFDLDEGQEIERRPADDLYTLDMYLVYTSEDPDRALAEATAAAHAIEAAFASKLNKQNTGWELIELRGCTPISDAAIDGKTSK